MAVNYHTASLMTGQSTFLSVKALSYKLGDQAILDNVSLEVSKGETVALLGPNGAGKSTLIDLITGMLPATQGEVSVASQTFEKVKSRTGVVFEYTPLFDYLTPAEIIKYHAVIHGVPFSQLDPLIEQLQMTAILDKHGHVLSNGERRKVGIVLALLHDPDFLILDESTANLDPFIRERCWQLFRKPGRTIFFSTHNWEEAERFADRILFINQGKVYAADTPEALMSDKYLPADKKVILDRGALEWGPTSDVEYVSEEEKVYFFPRDLAGFLASVKDKTNSISILPKDLKDVFLYLTKKKLL